MNGLKLEQIYFLFKIPNVFYFFILKMKVSVLVFILLIAALSEEKCRTFNTSFKFSNNQKSDVDKSVLYTRSGTTLNCRLLITMKTALFCCDANVSFQVLFCEWLQIFSAFICLWNLIGMQHFCAENSITDW